MPPTLKLLPNLSQQRQQFQQIKDKLNQATTDEQLKRSSPPSTQGRSPKINKL